MNAKVTQFFTGLRRSCSNIRTLTAMQLKEKLDMSYTRSFKKSLFHAVYFLLEFAVVAVICFFVLHAAKILSIFSLIGDIPVSVMAIVFAAMMLLSVIFTTIGLVNSLYLSRDNQVLLTLPAKPSHVFLSKLLVYYVYELRKNFMFLIPLFCAYGIIKALPVWYFAWALVLFVFISVLPVLVAALLSMPALFIAQFCRKFKIVQYILAALAIAACVWAAISFISIIPENIDIVATWGTTYWEIQDFLEAFVNAVPWFMALTELIVGKSVGFTNVVITRNTAGTLAVVIGLIVVLVALCFLLSQPLFYSMASKPFEHKKKVYDRGKPNRTTPVFLSAVKKETIVSLRDNTVLSLFIQLAVIMPLAIVLLNKLYSAMNTRFLGTQLTVAFNFLIVALFMLSANVRIASAYSRDGSTAYLNKVQPSTFGKLLFSKLCVNLFMGLVGVVATTICFANASTLSSTNNVLFGVSVYALYVCHLFWSAEMDIMNPQYEQYATFAEQSNNPNENKSTLLCFFMSVLPALILMLLSMESVDAAWIKVTAICVVLCVMKIITYFLKIKVFYKEK